MVINKLSEITMERDFLQKIVDFILQNITNSSLNIVNLANFLNMSRSSTYRKINALKGNTIVELIKIIRLKETLTLMETNKYSLSEISYMVGFLHHPILLKNSKNIMGNLHQNI